MVVIPKCCYKFACPPWIRNTNLRYEMYMKRGHIAKYVSFSTGLRMEKSKGTGGDKHNNEAD